MRSRERVIAIQRISFTVAELARTAHFYGGLGFRPAGTEIVGSEDLAVLGLTQSRAERLVMNLGLQEVEFLCFDPPGRPYPEGSTSTDLWFQHIAIVVAEMGEAYRRLAELPFRPVSADGPQHLPQNTGGVTAFKFRDPDGHPLELLQFPFGTGDLAWHAEQLASAFLGIDHTAIAVGDTALSQRFYEELGFRRAAHTVNRGPEQQRLDDVAPDVVDAIALEPERKTPHLELLGYRTGTRRPIPPGLRADDIAATRTILRGDGGPEPALLRDPDGHALVMMPDGDS